MNQYRLILNEQKYKIFRKKFGKYFRKHFCAKDFLSVNETTISSVRNLLFFEQSNNYKNQMEYAFKEYYWVPFDIEKQFILNCYDIEEIKDIEKYAVISYYPWRPFWGTIFICLIVWLWFFISFMAVFLTIPMGLWAIILLLSYKEITYSFPPESIIHLTNAQKEAFLAPFLHERWKSNSKTQAQRNHSHSSISPKSGVIKSVLSSEEQKESKIPSSLTPKENFTRILDKKSIEIMHKMPSNLVQEKQEDILDYVAKSICYNENLMKEIYANAPYQAYLDIMEDFEIKEEKRLVSHITYEGRISSKDKRRIKQILGYTCQACHKKMTDTYGEIGKNCIELHHKIPYEALKENDTPFLSADDFCVLCPDCHKMIHKLKNSDDIELLSAIIEVNKKI